MSDSLPGEFIWTLRDLMRPTPSRSRCVRRTFSFVPQRCSARKTCRPGPSALASKNCTWLTLGDVALRALKWDSKGGERAEEEEEDEGYGGDHRDAGSRLNRGAERGERVTLG